MQLQNTFYVVAIVCMLLQVIFLVGIIFFLFYIKRRVGEAFDTVQTELLMVKELISHPQELATSIGAVIAEKAMGKMKRSFPFFR